MSEHPVNCTPCELSTFLQVLAEGYLQTSWSVTSQSAPSRSMTIASKSWQSGRKTVTSLGFQFTLTSQPLTESPGAELSTSSAADSHARTLAQQEKEQESPESGADSGGTWRELSVKFNQDTCSWKTLRCLFPEDLDWSSLTLPKWGMLQSGALWERTTPALPTEGKGAGLWHTPRASDTGRGEKSETFVKRNGDRGDHCFQGLAAQVSANLWPTPTLCGNYNRKGASSTSGDGLETAVKTWPTPTRRDYKGERGADANERKGNPTDTLPNAVAKWPTPNASDCRDRGNMSMPCIQRRVEIGKQVGLKMAANDGTQPGTLSPDWVELLMGWPMGWTSMEPLTELRVPTTEQWQDGTWELGVPRVGVKIPDRVNRLKAIGNGQVPQAAAMAWEILNARL